MVSRKNSVPQVFLSLSGHDDDFVEMVLKHLPQGLAFYYRQSFENGSKLVDAMEAAVTQSSVFAFFASAVSVKSIWAGFEIDRARIEKIKRPNLKIVVFPLSTEVEVSSLPAWMHEYWIPNAGMSPRDIARYIRHLLLSPGIAPAALSIPVFGRGQLLDIATQNYMMGVASSGVAPNVLLLAGIAGIGRRTFGKYFCDHAIPAMPNLARGPEFYFPEFADLADLFRALREVVEQDFSLDRFARDLEFFREMRIEEQIQEIVGSLKYFGRLGQAVFVATGSGLFDDQGFPKPWVPLLFNSLASEQEVKLVLISNRQIRAEQMHRWPNVMQIVVPTINDADVQALMTATSALYGIDPVAPSQSLIRSIGGHADVAKAGVRLIAQRGISYLESRPNILFGIQDEILSENLDVDALTDIQKEILCLLSWVPHLDGKIIQQVLRARHKTSLEDFAAALEDLILGCLIGITESSYFISAAIRQMFRRKYGYGPAGLLKEFSGVLAKAWEETANGKEFNSELFDAFVFMHVLEGKSLPTEFRSLLLPSTLREIIRDAYGRGRDDDDADALRRVTSWGRAAESMRMDEGVREEILSTVISAHIRMAEYKDAQELLVFFDKSGYRSASFLKGFMLRRRGKFREAIPFLKDAIKTKKFLKSAVQELATCFKKLGERRELAGLVYEYRDVVDNSASLLDFRIGTLIAGQRIDEARAGIRKLRTLPDDQGRATTREAQILIQERKYQDAEDLLSGLVNSRTGNAVSVRRWRAIAAANAGHLDLARNDVEFIRRRPGRQETASRLDIYIAIAEGKLDRAEELFGKLEHSARDDLLEMRILEARANDITLPLTKREEFRDKAVVMRAKNTETEFDDDFD